MPSERERILELAIESLENKKRRLDEEIAQIARELNRARGAKSSPAPQPGAPAPAPSRKRRSRFSKEERERRSARMKAYWDKWRQQKKGEAPK